MPRTAAELDAEVAAATPPGMAAITAIRISRMWETCQRTTFFVVLDSDEGFEMCVANHATGSVYTDHEGLSVEEARDRALIDADRWGDFLRLKPVPFEDEGVVVEPSMTMRSCETQRVLALRRSKRDD